MNKKIPAVISVHVSGDLFLSSQFGDISNRPKTMSIGEYGLNRGLDRVLDVLRDKEIRGTFFVPGAICEKYPEQIRQIAEQGHEIANHGLNHENFADYTYEQQLEIFQRSNEIIRNVTGVTPIGFRAPLTGDMTTETLRALEASGFEYSSSLFDDDDPYQIKIGGRETGLTEIPIKWPLYDLPYFLLCFSPAFPVSQSRVSQYSRVLFNWKIEYDGAEKYEVPYILMLDTQTIAKPGRIGLLEEIIDYIRSKETGEFMMLKEIYTQE